MELRVLRYFLTVTREENITKAAELLHITQPALSRQMIDLEGEIGKPLFTRGKKKLMLTNAGMLLRKRAEEIIALVDKAENEMKTNEEIIAGDIFIGCCESKVISELMTKFAAFQGEYPRVHYQFFSGTAKDICERLDKGLLDFGVVHGAVNLKKYDRLPLTECDCWGLLMRRDASLAQKGQVVASDLHRIPLIVARRVLNYGEELIDWLRVDPSELTVVSTYNMGYNAVLMAESGMGYLLCLDQLACIAAQDKLCFKPLSPTLSAPVSIIWKKHQVFPSTACHFLQFLQENIPTSEPQDL